MICLPPLTMACTNYDANPQLGPEYTQSRNDRIQHCQPRGQARGQEAEQESGEPQPEDDGHLRGQREEHRHHGGQGAPHRTQGAEEEQPGGDGGGHPGQDPHQGGPVLHLPEPAPSGQRHTDPR